MSLTPIRNLGSIGIVKDKDSYDLPPNAFSGGLNVISEDGAIIKALGYDNVSWVDSAVFGCGWYNTVENSHIYVKSDGSIHRWNGTALTPYDANIINNGNDYYQFAKAGTHLIINNGIDVPFTASPGGLGLPTISLDYLANWDSTWRCKVIKIYKTFMVAIGMQKGSTEYPMMIKWSDAIEPNSTNANWDETDVNSLAGENVLTGGDGEILNIEELGDQLMIYTPSSVWSMQFVGGQYVFNFRKVFADTGIASQDCVVEFDGKHFCVAIDDIYVQNGTTKESISDGRITNSFINECDDMSSVKVYKDSSNKLIYVCYKTKSSDYLNKAWVWNWVTNAWTNIELPNITQVFTAPRLGTPATYEDLTELYDTSTWTYNSLDPKYREEQMYWVRSDGFVDLNGTSYTHNGSQYSSYVEQVAIDLDEVTGSGTRDIKQLSRIYPQISGEGEVTIRVGGSNNPQGSIKWDIPVTYDIKTDHKVDTRITYRYLAIRLEQNTAGSFKLTGWDLDINPQRYQR
jgi:hypothetical protein